VPKHWIILIVGNTNETFGKNCKYLGTIIRFLITMKIIWGEIIIISNVPIKLSNGHPKLI